MTSLQIFFTGLFLFNGVFSENTGNAEVDVLQNEVSAGRSACDGGWLHSNELFQYGFAMKLILAIDTLGPCFRPIFDSEVESLFTKSDLDEAFANVSAQVCPSWTESKECLRRHLSNKCDSRETQNVEESIPFNGDLVISELLCEPVDGYNMLQMFKDAAVDGGLGDCLGEPNLVDQLYACVDKHADENELSAIAYKEFIPLIFECGNQKMKYCANGNMDQELALVSLWNKFQKATLVAYGTLWNHLTTSVSILDLLE